MEDVKPRTDEPAMPLISLVNEGGFFMGWSRGVRDDERVLASWRRWLSAKRAADPSFAPGASADRLPESFWDAKTYPAVAEWTGELEARMVARMRAFLRSIGVKALLTNDNCGPHFAALQRAAGDYDYIDAEFLLQDIAYFPLGHPSVGTPGVTVLSGENGITGILESLMNSLEGED